MRSHDSAPKQYQAAGCIRFGFDRKKTALDRLTGMLANYKTLPYVDAVQNGLVFGSSAVFMNSDIETFTIWKGAVKISLKASLAEAFEFLNRAVIEKNNPH